MHAGQPHSGRVAAALRTAKAPRARRASGGAALGDSAAPSDRVHAGPIHSPVAGRTDHLPMHVASGSYVIPADIISAMGEGNTMAGFRIASKIFARPDAPQAFAEGGEADAVPIVAAGGEYVIGPQDVAWLGGGDIDRGHAELDLFVRKQRAKTVATLKSLPGPKRD
jgi:hypothetical protein